MDENEIFEINEQISERDIVITCCGEDDYGNPKALVSVKLADINVNTGEERVLDEVIVESAIVNIFRSVVSTMVDLTFMDPEDYEFVSAVAHLQDFCRVDMEPGNSNVIRTIVVTVVPKKFESAYACGFHAAWNIQPSKVGVKNDTLRFVFDSDYFNVFVADREEIEKLSDSFTGWD